MIWLLDGNVLVALSIDTHEFHDRVHRWFDALTTLFATCAVTEGTLLRMHMRYATDRSPAAAWAVVAAIHRVPGHRFWSEGFSYLEVAPNYLTGAAQVTEAWLAELARRKQGKLATLDVGLTTTHADVSVLVPA